MNKEVVIPKFSNSDKQYNQVYGYFIIDLYENEIINAMQRYYKDSKITDFYFPWWNKYHTVSITTAHSQHISYIAKITLVPSKGTTYLGTDTLYFSLEPRLFSKETPSAKLIKYVHHDPPKQEKPH